MRRVFFCSLLILTFAECSNQKRNKDNFISSRDSSATSSIIRVIIYSEDSSVFESEIMFDTVLKEREGIAKFYHKNGKLKEQGFFHKDKQEGIWLLYDELGNKAAEVNFKNNNHDGVSIFYNEKGIITEKTNWLNGQLDGTSIEYYDDGKTKRLTNWVNGKKVKELKYPH